MALPQLRQPQGLDTLTFDNKRRSLLSNDIAS